MGYTHRNRAQDFTDSCDYDVDCCSMTVYLLDIITLCRAPWMLSIQINLPFTIITLYV